MRILKSKPVKPIVYFSEMNIGTDVFMSKSGSTYIKIKQVPGIRHNAVNLSTGKLVCFNLLTQVDHLPFATLVKDIREIMDPIANAAYEISSLDEDDCE